MTRFPRRRLALTSALGSIVVLLSCMTPSVAGAESGPQVRGVVLSPTGARVADIQVTDHDTHVVTTDANGRFTIPDVVSGEVCASVRQDQDLGGPTGWGTVCVRVPSGGSPAVTLRFAPGAAVGGAVTDARTGNPVAAADVTLDEPGIGYGITVTTDAYGRYRFRNMHTGVLTSLVLRAGGAPSASAEAPYGYDPAPQHLAGTVLLRAGQLRGDLNFVAAPLVRYLGNVVDGGGAAVANAVVAIQTSGDYLTTPATARGAYAVSLPWSGSARQCAWSRGTAAHPTGLAAVCRVEPATTTTVRRDLTVGAAGGALAGRVLTPDGAITAPSVVTLVAVPDGSNFALPGVVTGADYRIDGVPPGPAAQVFASVPSTTGAVAANSRPLRVRAGAVTDVSDIVLRTGGV